MRYIGPMIALALMTAPHGVFAHDPVAQTPSAVYSTPEAVLVDYRQAIEKLEAADMRGFFATDSLIFENGKAEGSFDNYLAHHLGPELSEFESFTFHDVETASSIMGDTAMASETYRYTILLKDWRTIERQGAATSLLVSDGDGWKIRQYHSSSRAPAKAG